MACASVEDFKSAFMELCLDVTSTLYMENCLLGKGPPQLQKPKRRDRRSRCFKDQVLVPKDPCEIAESVLVECRKNRKRMKSSATMEISDERLSKMARFTDKFNLRLYRPFLHYVPRLVNVVTVCCKYPSRSRL